MRLNPGSIKPGLSLGHLRGRRTDEAPTPAFRHALPRPHRGASSDDGEQLVPFGFRQRNGTTRPAVDPRLQERNDHAKFALAIAAAGTALPLAVPTAADAARPRHHYPHHYVHPCHRHNGTAGALIGGGAGALAGAAVTHGAAGPIVGGVGGALLGRHIERHNSRYRC